MVDLLDNLLLLGSATGVAALGANLRRGDRSNADDRLECIGIVCLIDCLRIAGELAQDIIVGIIANSNGNTDGILEPWVLLNTGRKMKGAVLKMCV